MIVGRHGDGLAIYIDTDVTGRSVCGDKLNVGRNGTYVENPSRIQ